MNYEHKRHGTDYTEEEKTKQKVKNFKLKFSRMTTCFATIASLCSYSIPVTEEQVMEQTNLTPRERLETIPNRVSETEEAVQEVLKRYSFFLEKTGLPTDQLESHFSDRQKRMDMFQIANEYGDAMFSLMRILESSKEGNGEFLRYLVI